MDHSEYAAELFVKGYNCAQSVAVAFCDVTGLSEDFSAKMASSFGGGMGRMREVCGAVSGMLMVLGLVYGYDTPGDDAAKRAQYQDVQHLAQVFREQCGSIICRELLGLARPEGIPQAEARTPEYYKKRPCPELVALAAQILEEWLGIPPGCKFRIPTKCGSLILVYFTIINLLDDINLTIIDNSGVCTVL